MTETAAGDGLAITPRRVAVIGAGYVGMPTAAVLAALGHHVTVAERDEDRRTALESGRSPMMEEGLEELLARTLSSGRLHFVASAAEAVVDAEVVFLCVATPTGSDERADVSDIEGAVREIAVSLAEGAVVVTKSTVPVGTTVLVANLLGRADVRVVSNPEFLREGHAVADTWHPDRIVIGADDVDAAHLVASLSRHGDVPLVVTNPQTAELVKYAANSFLAMKLSFANSMAQMCDVMGADVSVLAHSIGLDPRIGSAFLTPGPGWGGSCLPKDVAALRAIAEEAGVSLPLVDATIAVNESQSRYVADLCADLMGDGLRGAAVGALGLTFKARTADRRDSPSLAVVHELRRRGATVRAFDPTVRPGTEEEDLEDVELVHSVSEVVTNTALVVILTEWPEFARIDWPRAPDGGVILDTRGVVDVASATRDGWRVVVLGRPSRD